MRDRAMLADRVLSRTGRRRPRPYEVTHRHQDELRALELSCEALRRPRVDATLVSSLGGGDWYTARILSCCYSICWIRGSGSRLLPRS